MKLAFDTNVVIYAVDLTAPLHDSAQAVLELCAEHSYEVHVSELLFLEMLAMPGLSEPEAQDFYEIVRRLAGYNWPIDTEVLLMAARLCRNHTIRTPDAIHVASAIIHKADYFVTNDSALLKSKLEAITILSPRDVAAAISKS